MNTLASEQEKSRACDWFRKLRDQLCAAFEALEPEGARFEKTPWKRNANSDGGGGEMAILNGSVFEKAGIHISTVHGVLDDEFRAHVAGADENPQFWASGISVIAHPRNPHVPSAHMNTRMIVTQKSWFGGGGDLSPMLPDARHPNHDDTLAFHAALKKTCDAHDGAYYPRFKADCDKYFFLPHRTESRGTGGIFFDHLNNDDWEKDFAFVQDVGRTFCDIYPQIVARRMCAPFNDAEREQQLKQRGRYVEFNLLYDRGTLFGLKTGGNIEAILSSLPPLVRW